MTLISTPSASDENVQLTTLDNGIRIATERIPGVNGISIGLRVDAGSRDEAETHAGISHLLEHMVFKGTERRTARGIAEELDAVGGQIDAYTTKEYTGYGVRVLPEHVPVALDIVSDMLLHSLIDPNELELEKNVILEEYRSLEDSPEEFVHDVFSRLAWPEHTLGRPVIGYPDVITRLTRDDLIEHLEASYIPSRMVFAAAGNLDHETLVEDIAGQFGSLKGPAFTRELSEPEIRIETSIINRPIEQAHFVMGVQGVGENDPERWAIRVLNLIAGGGMSSRLFQEIREKRGLCYNIGADSTSYRDGGLFVVYADTSLDQMEEVRDLAASELKSLAEEGVRADELERAKNQVRTATLLSLDDAGSRMGRLARSLLYHGRIVPLTELMEKVEALTLIDIQRAAHRLFGTGEYAFAAIAPAKRRVRRKTAAAAALESRAGSEAGSRVE